MLILATADATLELKRQLDADGIPYTLRDNGLLEARLESDCYRSSFWLPCKQIISARIALPVTSVYSVHEKGGKICKMETFDGENYWVSENPIIISVEDCRLKKVEISITLDCNHGSLTLKELLAITNNKPLV